MGVAAAPALAFGPPGWVVFAVAAVATAAVGALSFSQSQARSEDKPRAIPRDVAVQDCNRRPWSVRVHAQGTDIGGSTGSTVGAPPIVQMSPVTTAQGIALAAATFSMLGARIQRNLEPGYERCVAFIRTRPPTGFLGKKSFFGRSHDNNRFDVDSFGLTPNFIV